MILLPHNEVPKGYRVAADILERLSINARDPYARALAAIHLAERREIDEILARYADQPIGCLIKEIRGEQ